MFYKIFIVFPIKMENLETEVLSVAEKLKKVRKALKLNQKDFGKPIGVGQDAISDYENGKHEPSNRIIYSIIKEYSIRSEWWEAEEGQMFEGSMSNISQRGNANSISSHNITTNINSKDEQIIRLETKVEMLEKEVERLTQLIRELSSKN